MTGTRLTQTSFARGELAPALYNRVEIEQYSIGCKQIKNGFIHQEGCVSNRSGLEFVGEAKNSNDETRVFEFCFNSEQTYMIEAGNKYFRFIQDGGYIVDDKGEIVEIQTPYAKEDLFQLKFVQSADILTITHINYPPMELARYAHDDWRLSEIRIKPIIAAPQNLKVAWTGSTSSNTRSYSYLITAVDKDTLEESERSAVVTGTGHREAYWTTSEYFTLTWDAVPNAAEYNVYRSVNGIFGYIGTAEGTSFTDDNIEPDLKSSAPITQNPFDNNNYPTCATYFQQRKVYACSNDNPQTFWASQTATSNNFNISRPLIASDAITQALADREVNEIRHLIGLNHLIALTSNTEYRINGSDGVFEANPAPVALVQSNYGSSHVQPIISGNMIIFIQSGGSVMRDLGYDYLTDSYDGSELSLFASHLFEGKTVKDMAYAKEPYRIIYVVFSDGTCAELTYNKKQKICGWARMVTDGFFESVATIREGQEDIAYFIIRRYIKPIYQGSYELLDAQINSNGETAYTYTCGEKTYYAKEDIAVGVEVYSDIDFEHFVGTVNVLNEDENVITIGGVLKRYIERTKTRIIKKAQEGFFVDSGLSAFFKTKVSTISGLSHLAGKNVIALSRGGVIENLHVDNDGKVVLPRPVSQITIGLPYMFRLETLNIEGENTQGLKKNINSVSVNIANSREEFLVGGNTGMYVDTYRSIESVNNSNKLFSKNISATPMNTPDADATIIVAQDKPLPLTILSLSAMFSLENISDTQ